MYIITAAIPAKTVRPFVQPVGKNVSNARMTAGATAAIPVRQSVTNVTGISVPAAIIAVSVIILFCLTAGLYVSFQWVNEGNWTSRSLYYVCWNYTKLAVGDSYDLAQPAIHIGFLDFTLFKEHADFYSTYKLLETTHHYEYTDKLQIRVLDLTKIELATKEDRDYNIDKWARLFKAQTWEDIRMLAVNDQAFTEAATTIYQLSEDERIRQQCEAREDYLRR